MSVGVACGKCGGPVYMVTCNSFSGSGHDWVIVGVCRACRMTAWTDDACLDCKAQAAQA
jgi:hypothetical protein